MQQVRRIKVGYATREGRLPKVARDARREVTGRDPRTVFLRFPSLRLSGHWLADAGFDVGDKVEVAVSDGSLVVTREGGEET